jgi:iron complex outermembrane receptor protein
VQLQANLGIYTLSGVDLTSSFAFNTGAGKLKVSVDGTYMQKYKYQREKDGAYNNNLGLFTADNGAITRWRHVLAIDWKQGPWGATLTQNFVAGYLDAKGGRSVGNVETWDLQGTWSGVKNLNVVLGFRNIFDRNPPASAQGQTFQVGYDPRYGDPFGRTLYGKISYAFK